MIAYYGNRISPNMTDTPEGYLICHDVPIARIGPMEYRRGEVQLDGDPVQTVKINRYPEDVFEAAAIASFEGKDITAGHPPDNVGPENYAAYSKGHVENVRRSISRSRSKYRQDRSCEFVHTFPSFLRHFGGGILYRYLMACASSGDHCHVIASNMSLLIVRAIRLIDAQVSTGYFPYDTIPNVVH
jgi:hypothetical protein